jgi:beta-lactamase regulating signal transducer with metallopeptidase domain
MPKNSTVYGSCWKGASDPAMTAAFNLNAIAQASTVQIVDCLVEGTLVAIFTGSVLRLIRRQSSVTRFAVWFSALMAIAVLPFFANSLGTHGTPSPLAIAARPALTLPGTWALYLFGAWVAIAAWHLTGVARGLRHLYQLRKSCVAIDPATLDPVLQNTLARNQSPRRIALCTSDLTNVPTALGLMKPAIVIPAWVMQELSPEELNQILLHEIAHLRRWDDWTNLAQKLVKALFFFHPAVWWIERKVSLEREMACDDAVLSETASPRAYAECLAHLAERTLIQRSLAFAQAALGKIHQTSLRVAQILDADRPTGKGRSWRPAVSLIAVFAVTCVVGIARAPKLIAFSDRGTSQVTASAIDSSVDQVAARRMLAAAPIVNVSAKLDPQRKTRLTRAKISTLANHSKSDIPATVSAMQSSLREQRAATLVHMTSANAAPLAFTETLFVVVEGTQNGPSEEPVLQIQMWRVVVLHPVVDPNSNRIPAKQT